CLDDASRSARTPEERDCVARIRKGYTRYREEFEEFRAEVERGGRLPRPGGLAEANPVRHVVDPARDLLRPHPEAMTAPARQSDRVSQELSLVMLLLGLGGPVSGLIIGYGMARGLSRSIYQLSVRVQDVAQRLGPSLERPAGPANGAAGPAVAEGDGWTI